MKAPNLLLKKSVDRITKQPRLTLMISDFGTAINGIKIKADTRLEPARFPSQTFPEKVPGTFGSTSGFFFWNATRLIRFDRTGHTGTPEWTAPEMWSRRGHLREYNSSCDIWGVGLVLYFLTFRALPWTCGREEEEKLKGLFPSPPLCGSRSATSSCLKDPNRYPPAPASFLEESSHFLASFLTFVV